MTKPLFLVLSLALTSATAMAADCNQNGIDDAVEIQGNPLLDCDGDGLLNVCEAASTANDDVGTVGYGLVADVPVTANDILPGSPTSLLTIEITSNPVQGFVQLLTPGVIRYNNNAPALARDCSSSTDIVRYRLRDCANNIVSNIATLTLTVTHPTPDCNCNWVVDTNEIANGLALDNDGNSVPDECQGPPEPCRIVPSGSPSSNRQIAPDLSADGRYLVYTETSVSGTFVRFVDRQLSTSELIAQSSTVSSSDAGAGISDDGRFVVFQGNSGTLVAGDTNGTRDVFVRDRQLSTTRRISLTTGWAQANGPSDSPSISGNGRWVAFRTSAPNILGAASGSRIYLFDLQAVAPANPLTPVIHAGAAAPNGACFVPSVSQDGRYVAFQSDATNLIPSGTDTNGATDIFRFDRLGVGGFVIQKVSVGLGGAQTNSWSNFPSLSTDGRYVAFASAASNLVASDVGGLTDAFVRDIVAGTTELVSIGGNGQAVGDLLRVRISTDGARVAFSTNAANMLPSGTNPSLVQHVHVRDLVTDTTSLWSVGDLGTPGNADSGAEGLDLGPGGEVVFSSSASNFVLTPLPLTRIFSRSCRPSIDPSVCVGDGSATECPCGNNSAVGSNRGCLHSAGAGARLVGAGVASLLGDTVSITLSDVPASGGQATTFFQGTRLAGGGAGTVFGDGLRCAIGTVLRLGTRSAATGGASFGHGIPGDPAISVQGAIPATGSTRYYQATYRNALAFCTASTFNTSNGLEIVWVP